MGIWRERKRQSGEDSAYAKLRQLGPQADCGDFFAASSDLDRYRRLEEMSWRAEASELQNLAWLLHAKHEETVLLAQQSPVDRCVDHVTRRSDFGRRCSSDRSRVGFDSLILLRQAAGAVNVPPNFWIVLVSTTGAFLLAGGVATLLVKVAGQFYRRAVEYSHESDFTRQLEVPVRLVLSTKSGAASHSEVAPAPTAPTESWTASRSEDDWRRAFTHLASQLARREKATSTADELDVSSLPGAIKEILEMLLKIRDRVGGGGSPPA